MIYILLIFLIVLSLLSLSIIYFFKNRNKVQEDNVSILEKLLEINIKDIEGTGKSIVDILKKYYAIEYVTIIINSNIIYSNAEKDSWLKIEEYCNSCEDKPLINYSDKPFSYAEERAIKYNFMVPMKIDKENLGILFIENSHLKFKEKQTDFFRIVSKNLSLLLRNSIYQNKIYQMAIRDKLTQQYNREYMDNTLKEAINQNESFVVAMLDIDHFKGFNDTYGHQFGDLTLVTVTKFISNQLAEKGIVFRYGGEEFIIYFKSSRIEYIYEIIEKLREGISKVVIDNGKFKVNVTVSFGIAQYPAHGRTIEQLIRCADEALYESKESGRNKSTIFKK